jgi:hypothetical protein
MEARVDGVATNQGAKILLKVDFFRIQIAVEIKIFRQKLTQVRPEI